MTQATLPEVRFYRANREWGEFSNLYPCPVSFDGVAYASSEHAYQAGKPKSKAVADWLAACPKPHILAAAAHALHPVWDIRKDWNETKVERMRQVLWAKFSQNPALAEKLLGTGDARLVEAGTTPNKVNRFWGEVDGKGTNQLGLLLMETRARLRGRKA